MTYDVQRSFVHAAGPMDIEGFADTMLDLTLHTSVPDQLSYVTEGYDGDDIVTDFHTDDGQVFHLSGTGEGLFFSGSDSFPWSLWLDESNGIIALRGDTDGNVETQEVNLFMNDIFYPLKDPESGPEVQGFIEMPETVSSPLFLIVDHYGSAWFYSHAEATSSESVTLLSALADHQKAGMYVFASNAFEGHGVPLDRSVAEKTRVSMELKIALLGDADKDRLGEQPFVLSGEKPAPHALWYTVSGAGKPLWLEGDVDGDFNSCEINIFLQGMSPLSFDQGLLADLV